MASSASVRGAAIFVPPVGVHPTWEHYSTQ
jgi:hypothetical protein